MTTQYMTRSAMADLLRSHEGMRPDLAHWILDRGVGFSVNGVRHVVRAHDAELERVLAAPPTTRAVAPVEPAIERAAPRADAPARDADSIVEDLLRGARHADDLSAEQLEEREHAAISRSALAAALDGDDDAPIEIETRSAPADDCDSIVDDLVSTARRVA